MSELKRNFKAGCLICGDDLIYLDTNQNMTCVFCHRNFSSNVCCRNGHYVCDECHGADAMDCIETFCRNTDMTDPFEMALMLMRHPSVKMHGNEHHFLIPAVLITSYLKHISRPEHLIEMLGKARKRAEKVPGGFCGTHGNCGAAVGTGIFISVITGATPLSRDEWRLANLMTSRALESIAKHGGPRCCKRNTFLAIEQSINFLQEMMSVRLPHSSKIKCEFSDFNNECLKDNCTYSN